MARAIHAAAKRAVRVLTQAIDRRARELRAESKKATAARKRKINLQLRKLRKTRSCVIMCSYGSSCALGNGH